MAPSIPLSARIRQKGATLVVSLILLLVLTVLGVSGMNTATLEIAMSSNAQFQQDAFQAAETGIDIAISSPPFTTVAPSVLPRTELGGAGTGVFTQATTTFQDPPTPVPDIAFSIGTTGSSIQAWHFDIVAVGEGPRNATSTHTQSFYVIGPGGF